MFQNKVNNIIYEIAQEEGLTYKEVKNIIKTHFLFARIKMGQGNPEKGKETFKQVRLPGFGNFAVYDKQLNSFMDNKDKLSEPQTASRDKYNKWEEYHMKGILSDKDKEIRDKLVKIDI